ncbi:mediator of RNA polymerase II transcription subunit 7 isoform X1 [Pteropus medius]|uniref:Mediator of RNA polymerase II transcription subunit 7 n=1 Tax=Pteropus vampyrus TaxID=132908 RepID=A0A6P6CAI4_PTEVA|nr:mediator of RNA polymerase II transcription subunit 7 [Pteropus vampyrus]XP_039732445.1 mediator of RNA polymerase II transcription subunit 7 isoform X1 [Pteropus giganteus]
MGEPQQVSALPPPPMQYIKEYTDENIQEGLAPRPPPPIKDSYMMFGNQFQCDDLIIRPLESQGIERLHPMQFDHKKELRKLNMSILINFLDLLDILIRSPGSIKREEKLEDLKLLFVHVHHLINEYRPHQARETLRVMMEVQKRQRLETAERFQKHLERVIEMIQNCLASLPDDLPHSEAGMRVKSEPMDADDSNNCIGQNEQQRENSDVAEIRLPCHGLHVPTPLASMEGHVTEFLAVEYGCRNPSLPHTWMILYSHPLVGWPHPGQLWKPS